MNADTNTALIVPAQPTHSAGTVATNDIRGIRPPVHVPPGWAWVLWVLGALALAAAIAALVMWLLKRRANQPSPPCEPAHVRARRRLADALALIGEPRFFCIAVSETVRVYLEERFELRAPERTTEEFLAELQTSPVLDAAQKLGLADFLSRCDMVKFAKYEPSREELMGLHAAAVRLVEETAPQPESAPQPEQVAA
jgi:hypothetical protein